MKKKIYRILNIIMGSFIGVFVGSGLYQYWHFQKYQDLYTMQSAPWYTDILVKGFFTLVVITVCLMIKAVLIENIGVMKKTAMILGIIFLFLTLTSGGYVIINHGQVNAGYAVIPGILAIICFGYYQSKK